MCLFMISSLFSQQCHESGVMEPILHMRLGRMQEFVLKAHHGWLLAEPGAKLSLDNTRELRSPQPLEPKLWLHPHILCF